MANAPPMNPPPANQPAANAPANAPSAAAANPQVQNNAAPAAPGELYGDQGGDEIAPADPRLPGTLLCACAEDTFFKISNPRFGSSSSPFAKGKALLIDYEMTRRGKNKGYNTLILRGGRFLPPRQP